MDIAIIGQTVYPHTNTRPIVAAARSSLPRRPTDPLRSLAAEEQATLARLARSPSEAASHVARAKVLRAVAAGQRSTAAAQAAGRRSGDAAAPLGARFHQHGRGALVPGQGGGPPPPSSVAQRNRILAEARRSPDRERDGTATGSRMTAACPEHGAGWAAPRQHRPHPRGAHRRGMEWATQPELVRNRDRAAQAQARHCHRR